MAASFDSSSHEAAVATVLKAASAGSARDDGTFMLSKEYRRGWTVSGRGMDRKKTSEKTWHLSTSMVSAGIATGITYSDLQTEHPAELLCAVPKLSTTLIGAPERP